MIYISAQPDEFYFLWQLKLQLYNFSSLGITKENIHVLIGYNPKKGLNTFFKDFVNNNDYAYFFLYEDTRVHKEYPSSIRPHLLKKHFRKYPDLEKECFFYHDSDIIFRERPDLYKLEKDSNWYASDTRSYLDYNYIVNNSNPDVFLEMCKIVGISPKLVIENSNSAGGAQYILKDMSFSFWDKVEYDCERMFSFLKSKIRRVGIFNKENSKILPLDFWVTDMWVVWWNALLNGKKLTLVPELNFCWATSAIEKWDLCNILHYTGFKSPMDNRFFIKTKYKFSEPFYDNFKLIDKRYCSKIVVDAIKDYKKHIIERNRIQINDFTIILLIKNQSFFEINTLINFLEKHIETKIILVHTIPNIGIDIQQFNKKIIYYQTDIESIIKSINTLYVILIEPNILPSYETLLNIINFSRNNSFFKLECYGKTRKVDILSKYLFGKILDSSYLVSNQNKMLIQSENQNLGIKVYTLSSFERKEIKYNCDCFIL